MWRGFEEGAVAARQKHHPGGHKQSQSEESQDLEWDFFFFFQQLSVKSNWILDLAIRYGNFSKSMETSNNEKEIFLVLYLAQTPTITSWVVPDWSLEGDHSFLQKIPGLPLGLRVKGLYWGPSHIPRICGQGWVHWQRPAKEAAVCQCYFKPASLAGAVILFHFPEGKKIKFKKTKELGWKGVCRREPK